MCIYLKDSTILTYNTQEHVLPTALGCCTKLDKGIVSDQANEYFSPLERDVIEHSFIQIPRIINGPGKRGKLAEKYATTSDVCVIKQNGKNGLGYMKGTNGYILSQFIFDENWNIQFHYQPEDGINAQNEMDKLKKHVLLMNDKYVPVKMPQDDKCVYIAYYKDKIYIGFYGILSDDKLKEIRNLLAENITMSKKSTSYGQISATIPIKHDFKKLYILAVKSALNTLAYLKGAEFITQTTDFDSVIGQIMSGSDDILNTVKEISFETVKVIRQKFYLDNEQLACILYQQHGGLKAIFFVYDYGFEVVLCEYCTTPCDIMLDGIVCDWKRRQDYRFLD